MILVNVFDYNEQRVHSDYISNLYSVFCVCNEHTQKRSDTISVKMSITAVLL